ncbi:carbonic anhydrase-related protein 10-like [Tachypleus tridentatus]|uniref:carbonic anhydrase-related protein 10-like n=1 Tax=Tachypleus tridentatus TaxID=6853 RepID=UPI003FD1CF9F
MKTRAVSISVICQLLLYLEGVSSNWEDWWTYDGISGPNFWGLLNPDWKLCDKGRRQSPINMDPSTLLFDPQLRPLQIDKLRVSGILRNTGHSIIFDADTSPAVAAVNVTGGPLSYKYRLQQIHIHYGREDSRGSEHMIGGYAFPAELQIIGYNSDLYPNMTEALRLHKNQGLVGLSALMQSGDLSNAELRIVTRKLDDITFRGQEAKIEHLSFRELLPKTDFYVTYDGSTTLPGCYETVTWIIMNKPIFITKQQLHALRKLKQGDKPTPKAPLADNFRPIQALNHRVVRTNIDFRRPRGTHCPTMFQDLKYRVNSQSWNDGS